MSPPMASTPTKGAISPAFEADDAEDAEHGGGPRSRRYQEQSCAQDEAQGGGGIEPEGSVERPRDGEQPTRLPAIVCRHISCWA